MDDGAARGAEGHPDADLARALRHGVRQHAEDPDRGEEQRHRREDRQQQHVEALLRDRLGDDRVERARRSTAAGSGRRRRPSARTASASDVRRDGGLQDDGHERHRPLPVAAGRSAADSARSARRPSRRRRCRRLRRRPWASPGPRPHPSVIVLPIGSSPGKYCRAALSVISTTRGVPSLSSSVKPRPRLIGIPTVAEVAGRRDAHLHRRLQRGWHRRPARQSRTR